MQSKLDETLGRLIAEDFEVSPEEITTEFIHAQREESVYPKAHFNLDTRYGGHLTTGRRLLTPEELQELRAGAEAFLAQFAAVADEPEKVQQ